MKDTSDTVFLFLNGRCKGNGPGDSSRNVANKLKLKILESLNVSFSNESKSLLIKRSSSGPHF